VSQLLIERFPKLKPRTLKHHPALPEPVERSRQ
jgi:hypothetical protein